MLKKDLARWTVARLEGILRELNNTGSDTRLRAWIEQELTRRNLKPSNTY